MKIFLQKSEKLFAFSTIMRTFAYEIKREQNMTQFNISNIIRDYDLDTDKLSEALFPDAKFPKLALNRIVKGESSLSVEQLERLASYIGVLPSELFMAGSWKDASENGRLGFKKGVFRIMLNYNNSFLTVYKNGKVVAELIPNVQDMTVSEFTEYLDNLITKY